MSSSRLRSVGIGWEDMILAGIEDPHDWVDAWNLELSEWDPTLGKIECVFLLYDTMKWKWDDVYLLRGLPNIYSLSLWPPPLPLDLCTTTIARSRCTWRPWSSVYADSLGDWDRVNSEMHLQTEIERVWRCTLTPRDWVNCEKHFEAVIERVGRYTWRPRSNKIGGVTGGGWFGSDWSEGGQSGGSQSGGSAPGGSESGGVRSGGLCDGSLDCIHWLTRMCGNVENWVQHGPLSACETGWERETVDLGMMQCVVYTVCRECSTQSMLNSVYTVLGVCCTRCQLMIMTWRDWEGWLNFVFLGDSRVADETERDVKRWGKSPRETGT